MYGGYTNTRKGKSGGTLKKGKRKATEMGLEAELKTELAALEAE
jgi:hypothetical protein